MDIRDVPTEQLEKDLAVTARVNGTSDVATVMLRRELERRKHPAVLHDPFKDPPAPRIVSITLPLSTGPAEGFGLPALSANFPFRTGSRRRREALKRLARGLKATGACLACGKRIHSTSDSLLWLLEQIADQLEDSAAADSAGEAPGSTRPAAIAEDQEAGA